MSTERDEAISQAQLNATDPEARDGPHNVGTQPEDARGPMLGGLADPNSPMSRLWKRETQDAGLADDNSESRTYAETAPNDDSREVTGHGSPVESTPETMTVSDPNEE